MQLHVLLLLVCYEKACRFTYLVYWESLAPPVGPPSPTPGGFLFGLSPPSLPQMNGKGGGGRHVGRFLGPEPFPALLWCPRVHSSQPFRSLCTCCKPVWESRIFTAASRTGTNVQKVFVNVLLIFFYGVQMQFSLLKQKHVNNVIFVND